MQNTGTQNPSTETGSGPPRRAQGRSYQQIERRMSPGKRDGLEPFLNFQEESEQLAARRDRERRRYHARQPKPISGVLAKVLQQRGYGQVLTDGRLQEVWQQAAGQLLAGASRAVRIRRGKLEVIVSNSVMRQEIEYQKSELLARLNQAASELNIRDLRFRIGPLS